MKKYISYFNKTWLNKLPNSHYASLTTNMLPIQKIYCAQKNCKRSALTQDCNVADDTINFYHSRLNNKVTYCFQS